MADASTSKAASDGAQLTYNETIEVLCGFIKTAIHTILCHRQVYPSNVFTRRQRYRVPVWASRHPGLTAYIDELIAATKVQIEKSSLRSVQVVLTSNSTGEVLERYRFDIVTLLNNIQPRDRNLSIPGNMTMETIELHLRAFMMKLISLDGALTDLEDAEDITWAVVLDMKDGLDPQTDDKSGNEPAQGSWVPFVESMSSDTRSQALRETDRENDDSANLQAMHPSIREQEPSEEDGPFILPVKSLDTGVINLMLFAEENPRAKRASQKGKIGKGSQARLHARKSQTGEAPLAESIRLGERDIDMPLPQPSSSGAVAGRTGRRKKKSKSGPTEGEEADDSSDSPSMASSGSGDSLRSVNDFAGYGKGAGSVGMSGVGM